MIIQVWSPVKTSFSTRFLGSDAEAFPDLQYSSLVMSPCLLPPLWPCGEVYASRAADLVSIPAFVVDLFQVESYMSYQVLQ